MLLNSDIWTRVRDMRSYTDSGSREMATKYKDYHGSLGFEYGAFVAYIVDSLYISNALAGSWTQVTTSGSVGYKYENQTDDSVDQVRQINNRKVGVKKYRIVDVPKPDQVLNGFVANIHTHPRQSHPNGNGYFYGFYSPTDLRSLLQSNIPISGLITDKFWMLAKTFDSKMPSEDFFIKCERSGLEGHEQLIDTLKSELPKYNMILYYASGFGWELERIV